MPSQRSKQRALRETLRGVESAESGRSWPVKLLQRSKGRTMKREMTPAKPSASILLISPSNRILLLQRVNNSTSFASAHVFPGGHVDSQDGTLPPISDPKCHEDGPAYRLAAIRECFEESGILLAHSASNPAALIELSAQERDEGRKAVYAEKITFRDWLRESGAVPDTEALIPFTRWLTPALISKRYSTQMYLYFLPLDAPLAGGAQHQQHIPTPDGGIEHISARFLHAQEWLDMSARKEIVVFPPQFVLLWLIAPFLRAPADGSRLEREELEEQREALRRWVKEDGEPSWGEKCISPDAVKHVKDKYMLLGLEKAGPELEGTERRGDMEMVVRVVRDRDTASVKQGPRPVEVCWRKDLLGKEADGAKL